MFGWFELSADLLMISQPWLAWSNLILRFPRLLMPPCQLDNYFVLESYSYTIPGFVNPRVDSWTCLSRLLPTTRTTISAHRIIIGTIVAPIESTSALCGVRRRQNDSRSVCVYVCFFCQTSTEEHTGFVVLVLVKIPSRTPVQEGLE